MTNTPTLDSIQAELDRLKAVQGNNLYEPDLPYVVIRTYSAGIHAGYLKRLDESTQTVELIKTRRIWNWKQCALSCSEISKNGVSAESKLSEEIERIILLEAIEVLFASSKAKENLTTLKAYNHND